MCIIIEIFLITIIILISCSTDISEQINLTLVLNNRIIIDSDTVWFNQVNTLLEKIGISSKKSITIWSSETI